MSSKCCKTQMKGKVILMGMKRSVVAGLLGLFLCSVIWHASADMVTSWEKHVMPDGSLSFYHPEGWLVEENESGIMVHDEESLEQLWLVILPYEEVWTAQEHAEFFLALIQADTPEVQSAEWELDESGNIAVFDLYYGIEEKNAEGYGLVIKDVDFEQVLWFHYLAPSYLFSEDRGLSLLEGFVNSLSSGSGALPPPGSLEANMERINRNAEGFLFVLEFALGSPLTLAEETLIANELKDVFMGYSEEELAPYDEYPHFFQFIMSVQDQEELAEIQRSLADSVWEWVEESDQDDPVVSLIRESLLQADRVLVPGRTPLTEVAAAAYAEFLAFAEHLGSNGTADPKKVSKRTIEEIKGQLIEAWGGLSQKEKEQVLGLPAVWTTLRRAISHGNEYDREHAITLIKNAAPQRSPEVQTSSDGETYDPVKWLNYQTTLEIQKQTFNHYMWSVGYHQTIYGY